MALERATFKWAGTTYPLTTAGGNTALRDADPAIYYLLDYWTTVLQTYLGDRWAAEMAALGTDAPPNLSPTLLVADTLSFDPLPHLTSEQLKFPLLSAYRLRHDDIEHSLSLFRTDIELRVAWTLPPLSAGQAERLMPILKAVADVLRDRTLEGGDASYQSGARVMALAGLMECGFRGARYASLIAGDMFFPTIDMVGQATERNMPVDGAFDALAGADVAIDNVDELAGTATDVASFKVTTDSAFTLGFSKGFH